MKPHDNVRRWAHKAPTAVLDYVADLGSWLGKAPDDPLLSVAVLSVNPVQDGGLSVLLPPEINYAPLVVLWLGGGVHGTEYAVALQARTALRTDTFIYLIGVIDPLIDLAGCIGPGLALR